jgi:hypothetical protein
MKNKNDQAVYKYLIIKRSKKILIKKEVNELCANQNIRIRT